MISLSEQKFEAHALVRAGAIQRRLEHVADVLVGGVLVALPWSVSATEILIVLWLIALLPTLSAEAVRREVMSAAGGLPVLLWLLGVLGMLWADASWSERIAGLSGFHKLLVVPLLLAQYRRWGQAQWVLLGFLGSCAVLMVVSWVLALDSDLPYRGRSSLGVPVRDYALQSTVFAICGFGLLGRAAEERGARTMTVLLLGAALFIGNILFVATARTTLVVMVVLLVVLGVRQFGWKGALGAALAGGILAGTGWASSPYLRQRVSAAVTEVQARGAENVITAVGLRLGYWKSSLQFIAEAPVIGHGTGTIAGLFRRDAAPDTDPMLLTDNPHNQILAVAIQLGGIGVLVLLVMWVAHLLLFRGGGLMAWFGLVVVLQNVIGSMFNTYLFESGQGWLYIFGIGITGGVVLSRTAAPATDERTA
jgi:O-antigen ligase